MTRYKLAHDLPTFEKGEVFILDDEGNLRRESDGLPAYMRNTIEKFPDILTKWFIPTVRDGLTKEAFKKYLDENPDQRFFQAITNFAGEYLSDDFKYVYVSKKPLDFYVQHYDKFKDSFSIECDELLNGGKHA